jgi:outer membrane protein TolC
MLEQPSTVQAPGFGAVEVAPFSEEMPPSLFGDTGLGDENVFPIDLPTALQLAGANNLQIAIARERVNQAGARAQLAGALWIPSLNAGVVYNNHSGRIQGTEGEVVEASRSSFFVGGAAVVGNSPATGSGGNPRMFVDLSLADALFEPLAARQLVRATSADRTTAFNDTLFEVSAAYLTLVRAQARLAITQEAVRNAEELAKITRDFAETGQGLQADADRAKVEVAARRRDALAAREDVAVVSAHLARLLRLDPSVQLQPAEQAPAPLEFVDPSSSLGTLISQAMAARPEVRSADAQRDATCYRQRQEQLRPWIPHLYAGVSGGGFGGGEGSDVDNFGGRSDFDVAAVWELQNLGVGNVARVRERRSAFRQANLAVQHVRDLIAAEVAQSYQRVHFRRRQIDVTQPQVETAHQSMRLNWDGIRGGELRPIEIQQAIGALATSRTQYLDAVVDYSIAQVQLLRAIGQPLPTTPSSSHQAGWSTK